MDIVGPLVESEMDLLSKYTVTVQLVNHLAESVERAFVHEKDTKFGIPQKLLTDHAIERWHRSLAKILRHFVSYNQSNWDQWVNFATFVHNTTPYMATGITPHEI
ncbi:hypothetical protein PR048_005880, partial [Dryococelus australis]